MAAAYVAATILFTWPLAWHVRTHLPAASAPSTRDDTLLLAWVLSWDVHQLLREPMHLFDANIFYPLRHTLAYSEALVSEALLLLPLAPLTPNPALLHNTTLLLSFVLGSVGAFLLIRHVTGDRLAAFLGGLIFAFAPYRFWQIDRLHALCVHWTPYLFLALDGYLERGGPRRAALLAGAFVLQALASVYVAYASAILVSVFLLGWLAMGVGAPGTRGRVLTTAGVLAAAAGVVAAVYAPYAVVRSEMAFARDPLQVVVHSVVPAELGRAAATVPRYLAAKLTTGQRGAGTLGLVGTVLSCVGVCAGGRKGRLYGALALVALLFSFGPVVLLPWGNGRWVSGPYRLFHAYLPGFTALREPRRWTGMVVACGSLAAGLGTAALLGSIRPSRLRLLLGGALAALVVLEVGWRPLALDAAPVPGERAPVYRVLAAAPESGAVVELPIGAEREEAVATYRAAYHLRPLLNGYSSFRPTTADLRRRLRRFPSRRTIALVRRLGVRFVVYDTQRPGARSLRALARRVERADPSARLRATAGGAALIELQPVAAVLPTTRASELPRSKWHVRASAGDAQPAVDGNVATHWSVAVDPDAGGGWYEVDLGERTTFDLLRIELGAHYGEYPRAWRVRARDGGREWIVATRRHAAAPLVSYRVDARRVIVDLPLPPTTASALRIEVPPLREPSRPPPFDLAADHRQWSRWGIHELRLYSRNPRPRS